jgi:hypothetical protein
LANPALDPHGKILDQSAKLTGSLLRHRKLQIFLLAGIKALAPSRCFGYITTAS